MSRFPEGEEVKVFTRPLWLTQNVHPPWKVSHNLLLTAWGRHEQDALIITQVTFRPGIPRRIKIVALLAALLFMKKVQ